MPRKLRAGVIGLGAGRAHIRGYGRHPQAEVVAICDLNPERLKAVGSEFGIRKRYKSAKAMLANAKLDVVSVCTPNVHHAALTIAALEAGCHVLCEKPMAMNATEATRMLRCARKTKRRLMINFSFRFSPMSQALKSQVDAGVLGDVYFARTVWHRRLGIPGRDWFGRKSMSGGGPLIDLGVHRLDLALWLMGHPEPRSVAGAAYDCLSKTLPAELQARFDCEDMAVGFVHFDNGASLAIEASWASMRPENEFMVTQLYGTKGGLVQRNVNGGYEFEARVFTREDGYDFEKTLTAASGDVPPSMAHFVDCILSGVPHQADGKEGLAVMKILDALYESAAVGRAVDVA